MRTALIPVKEMSQAKMRLADVLERDARGKLALAMLTDVIAACADSGAIGGVYVVSADSEVLCHVREMGAVPLAEPATMRGLNDSLTFAQRYLAHRIAVDELLIVPADLPLARADDVRAIADALCAGDAPRAVIVRSRDGGTNALALRPPEAIAPRFGPHSADAHVQAAREAGLDVVELALDRVAFDVDAPEDLDALASLPAGGATSGWLAARAHYAAERAR